MKRAVTLVRVSSTKQAIDGLSHEDQLKEIRAFILSSEWVEVKMFPLVESGADGERKFFKEVIDYCKDKSNKIDFVVVLNIGRFTREGSNAYKDWKDELEKGGVQLRDIVGTIQEKRNSMASVGLKYSWSEYYPSETQELIEAERFKTERREILTRTLKQSIIYLNLGYYLRPTPYGFKRIYVETEHGRRANIEPLANEEFFVKKIFQMRAEGYNQKEIAQEINNLGYKSRIRNRRDKRTQVSIGKIGNEPISDKRISEILKNTTYAGVICQKWTLMQPVKGKFKAIVDIDTFNKANKNQIMIVQNGDEVFTLYGEEINSRKTVKRVTKHNPLYPFKMVVSCPICRGDLRGSASTGRSGKKYPLYHCSKGHKQWSMPAKEFNDVVYDFIRHIEFDEGNHKLLEALFYEEWNSKRSDVIEESHTKEKCVTSLLVEQKTVINRIKTVDSDLVRKALEKEYEELDLKIEKARKTRDEQVNKEINIKQAFAYAKYFMEHLEELLIDTDNVRRQQQLFGMLFKELPTYKQIEDGTANLAEYFRLNKEKIRFCDPDRDRTGDLLRDRETC